MDIVITIRDSIHDGRSSDVLDFLDAANAAVARVKHAVPIDDGVSLLSIAIVPDPEVKPSEVQLPYVDRLSEGAESVVDHAHEGDKPANVKSKAKRNKKPKTKSEDSE
jgi:hypothetical protein